MTAMTEERIAELTSLDALWNGEQPRYGVQLHRRELLTEVRRLRAERLPEAIGRGMETARNLRAEIDRLRARERELHKALRRMCIRVNHSAFSCHAHIRTDLVSEDEYREVRCDGVWALGEAETHAPNCLAAPLPKEDEG